MESNNIKVNGIQSAERIHEIIQTLKSRPSSLDKRIILEFERSNDLFKKYLTYVYDDVNYVYYKGKMPIITKQLPSELNTDIDLSEMFSILDDMRNKVISGKKADAAIQDYLIGKDDVYTDLFYYVIKRKIQAGVGKSIINDIYNDIIEVSPYQRCESESYMKKRIDYKKGAIAQTKADGLFVNIKIYKSKKVICTTRTGKLIPPIKLLETLCGTQYQKDTDLDLILHGELLIKENGMLRDRATGNGKINKYILSNETRKTLLKKYDNAKTENAKLKIKNELRDLEKEWSTIESNIVIKLWDLMPLNNWKQLKYDKVVIDRFNDLITFLNSYRDSNSDNLANINNHDISLIKHKIVFNEVEAMDFYNQMILDGEEGMVIKNLNASWSDDVNREGIIKVKNFKESDLIIIGYNMAEETSSFAGGIGSLICESSDGLLKVNVSGMERHHRGLERVDALDASKGLKVIKDFNFEQYNGKVVAVKYTEVCKDKSSLQYSLSLPTVNSKVLEIRESHDKSIADSLDKIKADAGYKG